ncbi:hypothetical protein ASG22_09185 [Chryseobacterium sp. Leaf405]|uniref:hypothetical protein n=1 Tax=Chryseobacterium sp. Leaf405 TaxID=1736367 RepID=UPI0006FC5AA3|nr:hypothetical protein [Chryseobacterium sp. Leaf405]KQT24178.1 hypothetical protein ASG22_09185 [Chryseobacterium sp. Leaf405]
MGKINIIGNQNPEIGIPHEYSIFKAFEMSPIQSPVFGTSQEMAHWEIFVLERNSWRKTEGNAKTGEQVSYTFNQKSLTRKGVKIIVTKGNDKAELTIQTKPAKKPKINTIDLLDINGHKVTAPLSYADTLIAKAYCTDMEGESLHFTLWEDDAKREGHNKINEVNKINPIPQRATVKKGIAQVSFNMAQYTIASRIANMQVAKGDKNEGKTHEYYVTAEYYGKLKASNNVNLKNPDYNTHQNTEQKKTHVADQHDSTSVKPATPIKQPNKKPEPPKPAPKKETYKIPVTQGAKTKAPDPQGKIISVEFVDFMGNPYKSMKFGTQVKAKIVTQNMKGRSVKLKIWEDDISNQLVFEHNYILGGDESYATIALTEEMRKKGDDWKEGREQEYFLEIEYAGQTVDSGAINVNDSAPQIKPEASRSVAVVKKPPKEKFDKVVGLGEEAVIYITSEIATEIKVDKNEKIISYPDYGGYNDMNEYKEGDKIYCKKTTRKKAGKDVIISAFPLYKMYIYRGKKVGEAVKKLKQDIANKTHENAESTVLTVARHAEINNKDYGKSGPLPPNTIESLYRIRYMQAWNYAKKESFRYRIISDNTSNMKPVDKVSSEVSSGAMALGSRGSISIDPWSSAGLIGCVGIRSANGDTHSSCEKEYPNQDKENYKFIYHALNNYLETIIPELKGVYGRRGYSNNGKVAVTISDYKEETKVFVLADPLPELSSCKLNLKKDGREEFYNEFGESAIKMVDKQKKSNKFKGLYIVSQRRQENSLKLKVPNNNPMNIKDTGDLGKSDLYTREVFNGKEVYINDGFGLFSTVEKGFEGYLKLLDRNFNDAYNAILDDTKTIDDFLSGMQDSGKKGAYATDPNYKTSIKGIFGGVVNDYKEILSYRLCKERTEDGKNKIKADIELLNKLK